MLGLSFSDSVCQLSEGDNLAQHTDLTDSIDKARSLDDVYPWLSVAVHESAGDRELMVLWFPNGVPDRFESKRSVFVASSRLNHIAQHNDWFDAFRTLTCRMDGEHTCLLTGQGTTADRFVKRAGHLFGIPVVSVSHGPKTVDKRWFLQTLKSAEPDSDNYNGFVFRFNSNSNQKALDPVLIQIADEVRALSVRQNGNVNKAISARCKQIENPNVFLLDSKLETKPDVLRRLFDAGCYRWILFGQEDGDQVQQPELEFRVPKVDELPAGEFLIHCTRGTTDTWPDQQESEYLDELIFQDAGRDHSLERALTRILATGRIHAGNRLTRDKQKVVCFTSATLEELKKLTKFRSHLKRWDFQPVGIAIRKSALKQRGARRVIYGDETTWENLPAKDQPFFQIAKSTTRTGNVLDWTVEKEWRVLGDVELREFKVGDIFAISAI